MANTRSNAAALANFALGAIEHAYYNNNKKFDDKFINFINAYYKKYNYDISVEQSSLYPTGKYYKLLLVKAYNEVNATEVNVTVPVMLRDNGTIDILQTEQAIISNEFFIN